MCPPTQILGIWHCKYYCCSFLRLNIFPVIPPDRPSKGQNKADPLNFTFPASSCSHPTFSKSWALTRMCSWSDLQDLHFKSSRGDLVYFHVLQHCPLFQVTLICLAFVHYTRQKHFFNVSRIFKTIISTVDVLVVLHTQWKSGIHISVQTMFIPNN